MPRNVAQWNFLRRKAARMIIWIFNLLSYCKNTEAAWIKFSRFTLHNSYFRTIKHASFKKQSAVQSPNQNWKSGAMKLFKFATVWAFFVFPFQLIVVNHVESSFSIPNIFRSLLNNAVYTPSQIADRMKTIETYIECIDVSLRKTAAERKDALKKFRQLVDYCNSDSIARETIDKKWIKNAIQFYRVE